MASKDKQYVFRWKEGNAEVPRSRSTDRDAVWWYAAHWLRPASLDDTEGEKYVREHGEVVEWSPE